MKTPIQRTRLCGLAALVAAAAILAGAGCDSTMQAQRPVTILLAEYKGEDAAAQAEILRKQVASVGVPDVFVVASAGEASVCAGHFNGLRDEKAHEVLKKVYLIRDAQGGQPFAQALLTATPEPLPRTPGRWTRPTGTTRSRWPSGRTPAAARRPRPTPPSCGPRGMRPTSTTAWT